MENSANVRRPSGTKFFAQYGRNVNPARALFRATLFESEVQDCSVGAYRHADALRLASYPLESGDAWHDDPVGPLNFYRGLAKNQIGSNIGVHWKASPAFTWEDS
jgi:hypothetical protein